MAYVSRHLAVSDIASKSSIKKEAPASPPRRKTTGGFPILFVFNSARRSHRGSVLSINFALILDGGWDCTGPLAGVGTDFSGGEVVFIYLFILLVWVSSVTRFGGRSWHLEALDLARFSIVLSRSAPLSGSFLFSLALGCAPDLEVFSSVM